MQDRALYSIQEARKLLGGISRNTIYGLLRTGELASVVIGLPPLHSGRCNRRARRPVDHDSQPLDHLDAISFDNSSGSSFASSDLPAEAPPPSWKLIPC